MNRSAWRRDHVITVLRREAPLTTREVADRMPPEAVVTVCPARNPFGCPPPSPRMVEFECDGAWHTYGWPVAVTDVYVALRFLERHGHVLRHQAGYRSGGLWSATGSEDAAAEVARLEQLLASS